MKTAICGILLLCAASQAFNGKSRAVSVKDNRALMQDIEKAKSDLSILSTSSSLTGSFEMTVVTFINEFGQYEMFNLYQKLLELQISENDVLAMRNETDAIIREISVTFITETQHPRDLKSSSGLSWIHLNNLKLDELSYHMNNIQTTERLVWYGVIDLENQMKSLQKDLRTKVDNLIVNLSEDEKYDIDCILVEMKTLSDKNIEYLRNSRIQLVDATTQAVTSLQTVINQVPSQ